MTKVCKPAGLLHPFTEGLLHLNGMNLNPAIGSTTKHLNPTKGNRVNRFACLKSIHPPAEMIK